MDADVNEQLDKLTGIHDGLCCLFGSLPAIMVRRRRKKVRVALSVAKREVKVNDSYEDSLWMVSMSCTGVVCGKLCGAWHFRMV